MKRFIAGELSPLDSSMANLLTRLIERLVRAGCAGVFFEISGALTGSDGAAGLVWGATG